MNSSVFKISLDIHKPESQVLLDMKRRDSSRAIHISLTENGRPYQITPDCSAVFTARKPDGNPIYNDCIIEGNVIIYKVTQQTVSCVGEIGCEIRLFNNDGGLITSPRFSILVDYTIYNGEEIVESAPEFDALQNRIDKADALYNTIKSAYENGELNGEDGEKGEKGDKGEPGEGGVPAVHIFPTDSKDGDMCLYAPQNTLTLADSGKRIYFDWEDFARPVDENDAIEFFAQIIKNNGEQNTTIELHKTSEESHCFIEDYTTNIVLYADFVNGVLVFASYGETEYNSIEEIPTYYQLPQFDTILNSTLTGNAYLFHNEYKLMKYQGGKWTEAVDVPTKTSQLVNDSGYITNSKIELTNESATLEPNTHYSFGEATTLTLEFAEGDTAKVNEYSFTFISGATPTVLTLPSSVQWVNELTVEANKRYEISIVDNIGLWCAVEVSE